jgi:RHS repeat-associated protein
LTDGAGAVAGRTRYAAFGAPQSTGAVDNGFTFTGHQYDDATGLVYARARYYDPSIGRFLSQDPDPSINPYAYAFDAPLEYTDPTGRAGLIERIKIAIFGPGPSVGYLASQAARDERARQAALKAAEMTVTVVKTWATPISDIWKAGGGG